MHEKHQWQLTPDSVAKTLTQAPELPQGLFERLKYTAEMVSRLDAAQLAGACLVYRGAGDSVHAAVLSRALTVVGRSDEAQLSIPGDRRLSRLHFQLHGDGGSYFIEDLGSTNGTRLNGVPLGSLQMLRSGDLVEAGMHVFAFIAHDPL